MNRRILSALAILRDRMKEEAEGIKENWWLEVGVGLLFFIPLLFYIFPGLYVEIKALQTLIGGLVGFGGLIAAVLISASKQRERDKEIRVEDTRALARALRIEIVNVRAILGVQRNTFRELLKTGETFQADEASSLFLVLPPSDVFERNTEKVGFLSDKIAEQVFHFYSTLNAYRRTVVPNCLTLELDTSSLNLLIPWINKSHERASRAIQLLHDYLGDKHAGAVKTEVSSRDDTKP